MLAYLNPHRLTLLLGAGILAAGCATASPEVKVLGVSQPRAQQAEQVVVVFLEIVNPTGRSLELSRLDYRLSAPDWLDTEGRVGLSRAVSAGSSTIVEIAVPVRRPDVPVAMAYSLEGTLFARENRIERSWSVAVTGALAERNARAGSARVRLAERAGD
jgi:LEA14-like dessication related protein